MTTASFDCVADSGMDAKHPDTSFGSAAVCEVGAAYSGGNKDSLFRAIGKFDLSSLVGLVVVDAAELHREIGYVGGGGFAAHLARVTRPSTWAEPYLTWNVYDAGLLWSTPGGDIDAGLSFAYTEATASGDHVISGLRALVEDALVYRGGVVAVRLAMDTDPGVTNRVQYISREGALYYSLPNWRLVVDYTLASPAGRRATGDAAERELAFDNLRGVRPRDGVVPRGGVLPRPPLTALMEVVR